MPAPSLMSGHDPPMLPENNWFADVPMVSVPLLVMDSHLSKFREYLEAGAAPGRALDFRCQEMFREFNTVGSKANDARITQTKMIVGENMVRDSGAHSLPVRD